MRRTSFQCMLIPAAASVLLNLVLATGSWAEVQQASAEVRFRGTSTLHDFEGSAAADPFTVEIRRDSATSQTIIHATALVPVIGMTTHHHKRDAKMHDMFERSQFAAIEGAVTNVVVPPAGEGAVKMLVRIRDEQQEVDATLSQWRDDGESGSFQLSFPISLKAFGLKPPSVLGVIRVGDEVWVDCTIQWPAQIDPSRPPDPETR